MTDAPETPEAAGSVPALLAAQAAVRPDALALSARSVDGRRRRLDYRALAEAAARAAGAVAAAGLGPGDRVAVLLTNDAAFECLLLALGAFERGAAVVPMNPRWADAELDHALALVEPALAVSDVAGAARIAALAPHVPARAIDGPDAFRPEAGPPAPARHPPAPDTLASLLFTSGTTARSKAVMHAHATTLAAGRACADALGLRPGDVYQGAFPFFTSSALNIACAACWSTGAGFVIEHPVSNAERVALVKAEGTTYYHGVPAVLRFMADEATATGTDLSGLATIAYGGAPMPPETRERLRRVCPRAREVQIYGSTESGPAGTVASEAEMARHPTAVGRAMAGYRIALVHEDGTPAAPGESGEVVLEGPGVALGYWRDAAATARTFRGRTVRMGDAGRLVEDGLLLFEDRAKDRINRGGLKIASIAVEAALLEHPAVAEAAVVGVPHEALGEDVAACLVMRPGAGETAETIRAFLAPRLADYEIPRRVLFLDALPRNPMGKVLKAELRARAADPAQGEGAPTAGR